MAKSIADSLGHRRHDRTMMEQGAVLGFRLNEPESAECYFCDGTGVIDSKEHILPQWLCAELGMTEQSFHSRNMSRGRVLSDQSRIPARNFVAKSICRNCNNGWMSQVEASFQPFIRGGRDAASLDAIARWFAKTAFVLDSSQPVRLLVPRQLRLGLAAGTFGERLSLYFHRTDEPARSDWRFDCFQGSLIAWMSPDKNKIAEIWDSVKQVWACSIRIDDIVGTVVVSPPRRVLGIIMERARERRGHRRSAQVKLQVAGLAERQAFRARRVHGSPPSRMDQEPHTGRAIPQPRRHRQHQHLPGRHVEGVPPTSAGRCRRPLPMNGQQSTHRYTEQATHLIARNE